MGQRIGLARARAGNDQHWRRAVGVADAMLNRRTLRVVEVGGSHANRGGGHGDTKQVSCFVRKRETSCRSNSPQAPIFPTPIFRAAY